MCDDLSTFCQEVRVKNHPKAEGNQTNFLQKRFVEPFIVEFVAILTSAEAGVSTWTGRIHWVRGSSHQWPLPKFDITTVHLNY